MTMPRYETAVLFGGSGFVGHHLATHLLDKNIVRRVVVADIQPPTGRRRAEVSFVNADVRQPIALNVAIMPPDLIVNLAAVHREPGHHPHEYFETNVRGAENVCGYAEAVGCRTLVFTSSISVYGPTEVLKDEGALPVPTSPYGSSKLVAERIHLAWQRAAPSNRLLTVRPGVLFGAGERGNVSRLVRAVVDRRFVYCGNQHVRKAGGYVKELCSAIAWGLAQLTEAEPTLLFNFTMDPAARLDDMVNAIAATAGVRPPSLSVPFASLLFASHLITAACRVANRTTQFQPARMWKLVRSNHIGAGVLRARNYEPMFSLESALRDWRTSSPSEW